MLSSYKKRVSKLGNNMGNALKNQSDMIMDATFTRDINYRKCYIDGTPVDAKFIKHTKFSISADATDFHLQFRPGKYYAIGKYVDIPDGDGVYHRWLIVNRNNDLQFTKYNVLKCDHVFKWMKDGVVYECLGVLRSQSSYNSGLVHSPFIR